MLIYTKILKIPTVINTKFLQKNFIIRHPVRYICMKLILVKNTRKIETTINIRISVKQCIILAALRSGISCSDVIISAMKCMIDNIGHTARTGFRVKYQERRDESEWDSLHLVLKPEDYEYFLDMKKFMKMSVSFLITRAIKKHMKEVIYNKTTDNYRLTNYIVIYEKVDQIPCWRIYWGMPAHLKRLIPYPLLL
jgi:hypothetical protein